MITPSICQIVSGTLSNRVKFARNVLEIDSLDVQGPGERGRGDPAVQQEGIRGGAHQVGRRHFHSRRRRHLPGTNFIKIGLPGKLILSKRKGLREVIFS